jgi:Bacitracin resistance protein BacA
MSLLKVILLAVVQGLAELLPVSSSAHVVVAEKLMGLDPSSPQMTLLLVMLHTGTMFAVIAFFWNTWKKEYFASTETFKQFAVHVLWATLLTGIVGEAIKKVIEKTLFRGAEKAEIEQLFSHLELIAPALAAAGVLILIAGLLERRQLAGGVLGHEGCSSYCDVLPGRLDGRCAGLGAAISRILPFRLYDFDRYVGWREQGARGALQFRLGRGPHACSRGLGGSAAAKGVAHRSACWIADRPERLSALQFVGDAVFVSGRPGCPQVAEQLA